MASALTPLGTRTRAGFIQKYGPKQGPAKFEAAMASGMIDRGKMENVGLVADADAASEGTESPTDDAAEGEVDAGPRGAPEHDTLTMMAGTKPPRMSPAEMAAMKKRMITSGKVGRAASGMLQKRPG